MRPSRKACVPERNASSAEEGIRGGAPGLVIGDTGTAARGVALPSGLGSGATPGVEPGNGTVTVARSGVGVPSKLTAGDSPTASASKPAPNKPTLRTASDVRIACLFRGRARMGDRAIAGGPDLLGVFPQIAGRECRL